MTDTRLEHLSESEITAYVDGELESQKRTLVSTHLEICAACRDEVGEIVRLLRAAPLPLAESQSWPRRSGIPRRAVIGIALAASIATVLLVARRDRFTAKQDNVRSTDSTVSSEARPIISAILPSDHDSIPADTVVFLWKSNPGGFYRITVTATNGAPVWVAETHDTVVALPDTVALQPRRLYFWYVDALGDGITATTGIRRFQVVR
jgi:anti-sigma factor ChrR (cupin superfamily)